MGFGFLFAGFIPALALRVSVFFSVSSVGLVNCLGLLCIVGVGTPERRVRGLSESDDCLWQSFVFILGNFLENWRGFCII